MSMLIPMLTTTTVLSLSGIARAQQPADPWWGHDKALHLSISTGMGAIGYGTLRLVGTNRTTSWVAGVGASVTVGAGKEIADMAGMGDPSWRDFTWDLIGSVVGATIAWSIDLAINGTTEGCETRAQVSTAPRSVGNALVLRF